MKQEILARSEEWHEVIQTECQNFLPAGQEAKWLSVWEQLKVIFNNGEEYDEHNDFDCKIHKKTSFLIIKTPSA